jgi:hypothetical protein
MDLIDVSPPGTGAAELAKISIIAIHFTKQRIVRPCGPESHGDPNGVDERFAP